MKEKINKFQERILLQKENEDLKEEVLRLQFKLNAVIYQIREFYPMVDGILWELGEFD